MRNLSLLLALLLSLNPAALRAADLPRLEPRGAATQLIVDGQPWLIRGGEVANTASSNLPYMDTVSVARDLDRIRAALGTAVGGAVEIRRVEFVGPQVGRDLQLQALYAVLAGMVGILIYVAIRFDFRGGVISIVALAHDVTVTLGMLSITNREMSLPVLAALLTIVGYSINDTIVVFDRIRESRGRGLRKGQNLVDLVNGAINQTLSRTVLTSFTVFVTAVVLLLFGGEVLHDFAFALVIGVITGTYSSIAAASLVMDWESWSRLRTRASGKVPVKA